MKRADWNFVYGVMFGCCGTIACFVSAPEFKAVRIAAIALAATGGVAYVLPEKQEDQES